MSKLFKELNYDTDRVVQPGDPLTSPDGKTVVSANNNGTATLNTTVQGYDTSVNGITDITAAQQAEIDQLAVTAYTGSFVTLRRDPNNDPGPTGGARYWVNFSQDGTDISSNNDMASAELYSDGTIRVYDGMPDLLSIFNASSENPAVIGHAPTSQTTVTKTIATEDQLPDMTPVAAKSAVNTAISTINTDFTTVKNAINGNNDIIYMTKNTLTSGWSIYDGDGGTANRIRLYHYGKIGFVFGTVKCTSALTANTSYTVGTVNIPSGFGLMAAHCTGADPALFWCLNSAGGLSLRTLVARNANVNLGIRIMVYLSSFSPTTTVSTVGDI